MSSQEQGSDQPTESSPTSSGSKFALVAVLPLVIVGSLLILLVVWLLAR